MSFSNLFKSILLGQLLIGSASVYATTTEPTSIESSLSIIGWEVQNLDGNGFIPTLNFDTTTLSSTQFADRAGNDLVNGDERVTGSQVFTGQSIASGAISEIIRLDWDFELNADPFIDGNLTIENLTNQQQTFTFTFGIPVNPQFTNGIESGFLGIGIEDTSGDGSASASLDWNGFISPDLVNIVNTYEIALVDPVSCSAGAPGCTAGTINVLTGDIEPVDGPTEFHTGDVQFIGIELELTLSAGDTATIESRYEVNPVPVPAAVWLLGSSLLALVGVRKSKG